MRGKGRVVPVHVIKVCRSRGTAALIIRFTLSGAGAENGRPCGLLSFPDPSWCHFDTQNSRVMRLGASRLWNCWRKLRCVIASDSILLHNSTAECGVALNSAPSEPQTSLYMMVCMKAAHSWHTGFQISKTVMCFWCNLYVTWTNAYAYAASQLMVHTHQQSWVKFNPVQPDSQRHGSDCVATRFVGRLNCRVLSTHVEWPLQSPLQPCIHTSQVESSWVPRVLPSQKSWCHMLHFCQSDSWSGVTEEMDVEKLIRLVKDHEAIYDASRCEHRNRVLLWRWCS